ncbi:MAG TPA: hypothetical protein VNL13_08070 [Sulfolobales archaeon]|nr:hypothetical protein [Sulfolobales archaeon]
MESEKILGSKLDTIARLGCFKPIYMLREYIAKGEVEKAEKILGELTEDLRRYSKDLVEMAQQLSRARNVATLAPEEAVKTLEGVLSVMRSKIFSSPPGVRLCINIQPHLEIMYTTLSALKEDLRRYSSSGRHFMEIALRDLEAYLAYISRYIEDLLNDLNKL